MPRVIRLSDSLLETEGHAQAWWGVFSENLMKESISPPEGMPLAGIHPEVARRGPTPINESGSRTLRTPVDNLLQCRL